MKSKTIIFSSIGLLVIATLFTACKKTAKEHQFTKSYGELSFTVDTISKVGPLFLASAEYLTDIEAELAEKDFGLNNLKKISVSNMTISITNPGQTLNYFRRIDVRVSNGQADDLNIGSITLPDETNVTSAVFSPVDAELTEIFKQKKVTFKFYGENDLPIVPDPLNMKVNVSLEFKAALGN
ncbi:MAG: hypothetical protein IT240_07920 [Bacteroidia bacterium]|jgi:hypothetical protein|nr:hypothetical protein [Bacteroidia bacterium]MCC6768956.1 hypothetical protein [Bacteroidia bacterium]